MTTQAPIIPPRPSRSPQPQSSLDAPKMPPRPAHRIERSVSPLRHNYAPSPLNDLPNSSNNLSRTTSNDLPQRPPSVTIPSLGEEGIEYEDLDYGSASDDRPTAPAETRNVGSDLKIHAPRPSLPNSSAKAQVQAVTRTDSRQAAAAGFGVASSPGPDDHSSDRPGRPRHSRGNGSRASDSSAASSNRRRSILEDDHGIPEIGQRVPMYRDAGDVQAPSPGPQHLEPGSQRTGRNHQRTRSRGGRESSLPPGSYGLHGHGVEPDKFEKAWYEKHPEEYTKEEHGHYGPGVGTPRPDWALSSDDLNKIVRGSAMTGSGLGTSPAVNGTPEEEVGYMASDEYSRHNAQPVVESPLRQSSFPASQQTATQKDEDVHKSEDAGVIHVDEPYHHLHHPDGFAFTPDPEAHANGVEEASDEEEPILAADEVRPESAFQHAAISPSFESRRDSFDHETRSRPSSASHSRSTSRPTSLHALPPLARLNSEDRENSHTPLEDVDEYEPLFPDDDGKKKKPLTAAERFKQRPELPKHRFPSQDIWEDSPNSLQLHATVSTPDLPKQENFETPEQESYRRSHASAVDAHSVATQILESEDRGKSSSRSTPSKQRFPSRDIWEDAPDSQQLVTTIEPSADNEARSPDVPTKPSIPARPQRLSQQIPPVNASAKPATSPTEKRQPPLIPDRPKPQIAARPAKPVSRGSVGESNDVPTKAKPPVPARPGGSKIAALKAGFLTDLNSRLQLGPQPPKQEKEEEEEPPAEKVPLTDARKGRARGPARRKPANEPAAASLPPIPEIKITETWNVWEVRADGNLVVGSEDKAAEKSEPVRPVEGSMAPEISQNAAGESTDPQPLPERLEGSTSPGTFEPTVPDAPSPSTDEVNILPIVNLPKPDLESSKSSSDSVIDEASEKLSASADGKKLSDGDIHDAE